MYKFKIIYLILILFLYSPSSNSEDTEKHIEMLENYLRSIKNMSFTFEQYSPNKEKETGWMQIDKPDKLRIEYKGDNDLIIISNSAYLILYKAEDDIITSLPIEGPWSILTKSDLQFSSNKNDTDADGIINNIKTLEINNINHIFFEVLMRHQDTQLLSPIILHASMKPFILKGWTIFNDNNEGTKIKIINNISLNESNINANIFRLSEKDRLAGNVWQGPFKKPQIIRQLKHRH